MKEGIQALEAVLALNGITMVNVGDKFVKAMAEAQGRGRRRPSAPTARPNCRTWANM